jgi:sterol 14-demethylase
MIAQEALEFLSTWKEETATVDLLKEMNNLTVLTASRCLLGKEIRDNPQVRNDFARLYHDLEGGINSISFFYPYVPIPAHIKRDRARKKIAQLFSSIIKARRQLPDDQKVTLN